MKLYAATTLVLIIGIREYLCISKLVFSPSQICKAKFISTGSFSLTRFFFFETADKKKFKRTFLVFFAGNGPSKSIFVGRESF